MASYLDARANQGRWLLRIDDLDTYRNVSGASQCIIDTLDCYRLHYDGPVYFQSKQLETYESVISNLQQLDLLYPCKCTRKSLNKFSVYPGFCLNHPVTQDLPHALRIKCKQSEIRFNDKIQGWLNSSMARQHGDFIIKRKDHIIAYQLAVVIDDCKQNITHVLRGFDLLDSTPKQLFLQHILGYPSPTYCHVPIITDSKGCKLSKQAFAQAVSIDQPGKTIFLLLQLLKQNPPDLLKKASVNELLNWAVNHWEPTKLKKIRAINSEIY